MEIQFLNLNFVFLSVVIFSSFLGHSPKVYFSTEIHEPSLLFVVAADDF